MCFSLQRPANFPQPNVQKCSDRGVLYILTCKCASRYSGVSFFDIQTFKTVSFLAFWLANVLRATAACHFSTSELPKVVQDRQFFSILTCKCASRHSGVPFLGIGTSKSGPLLGSLVNFYLKCASRHSDVQFFLFALSSHLRTRRFSEPTFRPSRHANHWKNTASWRLP